MGITAKAVRTAKVPGDEMITSTDVTFDNKYVTGGEPVTAANLGLDRVTDGWTNLKGGSESAEKRVVAAFFDVENMKVMLIDGATGKELASEADASKVVVRVYAVGK